MQRYLTVVVIVLLVVLGGVAVGQTGGGDVIDACADIKSGDLRMLLDGDACDLKKEAPVSWVDGETVSALSARLAAAEEEIAALGTPDIYVKDRRMQLLPGQAGGMQVNCEAGDIALSGGFSGADLWIHSMQSEPDYVVGEPPTGWWSGVMNRDTNNARWFTAYAVCMRTSE
jgi:hypothetical protein